jgi:hypothetical protein
MQLTNARVHRPRAPLAVLPFAWVVMAVLAGCASERAQNDAGPERVYGEAVAVGQGYARTYIEMDPADPNVPVEFGVAMDEGAMEGLPAPAAGDHAGHTPVAHEMVLPLPEPNPTPFQVVTLDWNPSGHIPDFYATPHFDFHFYTISAAERDAIDPQDPAFVERARKMPDSTLMLPGWAAAHVLMQAPPEAAVEPRMGTHWVNPASPEFPPTAAPFTHTYIQGSWDGRMIFHEPMITRAYLLAKRDAAEGAVRDEVVEIPLATRHERAGYYPAAYRMQWDEQAREWRVGLSRLTRKE